MVHLSSTSPLQLSSTSLKTWDQSVRDNFDLYQKQIDKTTYHLQRSQRGYSIFGSWFYPTFVQREIQNLKILRMKQQLGKILPEEVSQYKIVDQNIAQHLNRTFAAQWFLPSGSDFAVALALQAYAQVFNLQFSWRITFFIAPWFLHSAYKYGTNNSAVPTIEFMRWLTQIRKSKSQLELSENKIDKSLLEQYQKATQGIDKPLQDVYQEIIALALKQQPYL